MNAYAVEHAQLFAIYLTGHCAKLVGELVNYVKVVLSFNICTWQERVVFNFFAEFDLKSRVEEFVVRMLWVAAFYVVAKINRTNERSKRVN